MKFVAWRVGSSRGLGEKRDGEAGSWDGINYRQQIVDEAIRRHEEGFIINLMWHAVRPTDDEPVDFKASVQGKLMDEQWQQLLTPGTELNERWIGAAGHPTRHNGAVVATCRAIYITVDRTQFAGFPDPR